MGGGSSSKSEARDLTPQEFVNLRPGTASTLQWLLGLAPQQQPTGGSASSKPGASYGNFSPSLPAGFQPATILSGGAPQGGSIADKVGPGAPGIAGSPIFEGLLSNEDYAAQLGEDELAALGNVSDLAGGAFTAEQDALLRSILAGDELTPGSNPFLSDVIDLEQRRLLDVFNDEELEQRALFARAGQSLPESSPFAFARARATEGLLNAQGDIAARLSDANFQRASDRRLEAVAQATAVDAARFDRASANLEAQALPRLIEQFGIDKGTEEYNWRIEFLMNALGLAAQLGQPSLGTDSKSSQFSILS